MDDQSQGEQPDQSQEEPTQDSGLQTPQPDQPVPTEAERQSDAGPSGGNPVTGPGPSGQPAEGTAQAQPVGPSADEQADAHVQREQELEQERRERNERLGGEGDIRENEVQDQRQEHNERTGGGDVPGASSSSDE